MTKAKKFSMLAIVLLVVGIVGGLLTFKIQQPIETVTQEIPLSNADFANLAIKADNAKINIITTNDVSATKVEFTGYESKGENVAFDAAVNGDTLNVTLKKKQIKFFNFNFFDSLTWKSANINVYVPEKLYDKLHINLINGDINIDQLAVQNAEVEAVNGNINLKNVEASHTSASLHNGDISLENIQGDITGDIINGKIFVEADHLDRNINLKTTNGQINIKTEKEPTNAAFDISVVNGSVDVLGDSNRNAIFGNGEYKIALSTVNGKIAVTK